MVKKYFCIICHKKLLDSTRCKVDPEDDADFCSKCFRYWQRKGQGKTLDEVREMMRKDMEGKK